MKSSIIDKRYRLIVNILRHFTCMFPLVVGSLLAIPAPLAQGTDFPKPGHLPAITERFGSGMRVTPEARTYYYFVWEHSSSLMERWHWTIVDMALGSPSPTFSFVPDPIIPLRYYRARALDIWSPGDADGDGIDDLYELLNGLNPLNGSDAMQPSLSNPLLTNLEYYRNRFALYEADGSPPRTEYFSQEVSVANSPGTLSSEISVFKTDTPNPTLAEAISAEVSVFQSAAPLGIDSEAISAEVSVFKSTAPLGIDSEVISPEVSVLKAE